jgi:hypothetical protein
LIDEARRAARRVLELNSNFSLARFKVGFAAYLHPSYVERFEPFIQKIGFPDRTPE